MGWLKKLRAKRRRALERFACHKDAYGMDVVSSDYRHGVVSGFERYSYDLGSSRMINGDLTIYAGARWNGASGPTWDTRITKRGSCVHDHLYEGARAINPTSDAEWNLLQYAADQEFRRVMREDGVLSPRVRLWYRAVRWFGRSHIRSD